MEAFPDCPGQKAVRDTGRATRAVPSQTYWLIRGDPDLSLV
jgi:hypothetical protein